LTTTVTPSHGASDAPSPALAPPPGNPRFALFDSLRGLAAMAIVAFHVASITGWLSTRVAGDVVAVLGPRSLTLFFVISGFLLYRPFVAARAKGKPLPSVRRYGRRRVLRIVPAYWVALTVLAIFPGIVGVFTEHWWRYYFFLQLYWHDTLGGGIPVAWSLCVEVTFYLALPFWAMGIRRLHSRRGWLWDELVPLGLVALAGIVVQVLSYRLTISQTWGSSLLGQCVWIALGMALAVSSVAVERSDRETRLVRLIVERPELCWIGAAVSLAGLAAVLQPHGLAGIIEALSKEQSMGKILGGIALSGCFCALLVLPAVFGEDAGGIPRRILAAAPIAWLGMVSYGIYLYHLAVAEFIGLPKDPGHFSASGLGLAQKIHHATTPILFILTLALASVLAALSYYLIELPFLRRKER
jgi:peptidoglycan/LPS O-acetylase OafA/YrhL